MSCCSTPTPASASRRAVRRRRTRGHRHRRSPAAVADAGVNTRDLPTSATQGQGRRRPRPRRTPDAVILDPHGSAVTGRHRRHRPPRALQAGLRLVRPRRWPRLRLLVDGGFDLLDVTPSTCFPRPTIESSPTCACAREARPRLARPPPSSGRLGYDFEVVPPPSTKTPSRSARAPRRSRWPRPMSSRLAGRRRPRRRHRRRPARRLSASLRL
jgi:hypothetical protein